MSNANSNVSVLPAKGEPHEYIDLPMELAEYPVKLPDGRWWKLVEMTGAKRDEWLGSMKSRVRKNPQTGKDEVGDYTNIQASLIAACLVDEHGKPLPVERIAALPAKAQNMLFKKCNEMNGLGEETEAIKDQSKKD